MAMAIVNMQEFTLVARNSKLATSNNLLQTTNLNLWSGKTKTSFPPRKGGTPAGNLVPLILALSALDDGLQAADSR
ncbi:hypothetical protein PHYBLDRAFT_143454 [Phycomyces blakesleeanus NRRL 1555(-)]|uniref:Uncharacterized protein n=1 Tax=Phycomyces blakesleeanus (strain ATCC 8743b / DSM 1359 / FGSC 10004 / NBRC 33097 / NRRL 1555) TaxID=763407 RepID=A0A167NR01_PHYB8|nr:hypothetical protein PHYBLDRAFT_143454 [Phycomyces blakesleeanus NRRL 1555(-)]OAD76490.1 hypothetical protein PHYBLDRAFT_143454 [Phycomyces blakesleeanus NRRL 1555(-)]|eukprot:XP_018294530.1 hypothetical protein PHYBLDRAFT_143454 [Phycomyces blakesleeanus NRRL 1555(-)]